MNETVMPEEKFEMWARVDLFGHNQRAGRLTVVNTGVEILYRLDSPDGSGRFITEYFGRGAVYSIFPCAKEAAQLISKRIGSPAPISQWDLPESWREAIRVAAAQIPATTSKLGEKSRDNRFDDSFDNDDDDSEDFDDNER